jgi:hypothetical protein
MKHKNILYIVFILAFYNTKVNAQKLDLPNFLSEVGLNNYPIGSSINDLKEKPEFDKIENGVSIYFSNKLLPEEVFGFDINSYIHLTVIGDTIKKVQFEIGMDPDVYQGFLNTIINKYGEPSTTKKDYAELRKWIKGDFELRMIYYPGSVTFNVEFGKDVVPIIPPKQWIYSEREGKGTNKLSLNLKYFETLANSNLTSSQFEELMPIWFTSGLENHLQQSYNPVTKKHDIPLYSIEYEVRNELNKYLVEINTRDTTQKSISDYRFALINNQAIINTLKSDLQNFGYKIDMQGMALKRTIAGTSSNEKDYVNKSKEILISIGKTEAGYFIYVLKL